MVKVDISSSMSMCKGMILSSNKESKPTQNNNKNKNQNNSNKKNK